MARLLTASSTEDLEAGSAVATVVPITIVGWFKCVDTSNSQNFVSISKSGSGSNEDFRLNLNGSAQTVRAVVSAGGAFPLATSSDTWDSGVWHHGAAVFAANDSRAAYLDGGNKGTNGTSGTPSGINRTIIGAGYNPGSKAGFYDGDAAEVAIWSIALTDAEIAWLALGFSPVSLTHRLKNLVFYKDLIRTINHPGIGPSLTASGTAVSNHPGIFYPSAARVITVPTVVAGGNAGVRHWQHQRSYPRGVMSGVMRGVR